ncbi:PREDICTED: protein distal antenna [Ceratosolen solmsi marchali]|uniref:Protein distal antenna n=1 Tax=Ceratosolen solmsi marchali TaxID=326594 RepID=A0AAJ7E151_9HYME|nr:PREDICTED: protein distal antenna [Ceratosolen solmsi marchali]
MRGESARPGKRPLRALSASEKMEAIQRVHEGESKASVARDIGVPESTLRGWCKSEHKIRGMARNSSTPDSEAHSPASSSGANNTLASMAGASNLSSEDEAVVGPSSAKKLKLDALGVTENVDVVDSAKLEPKQPKMDYVSSIINSIVASGVRSENSSILLQQLGLLSSAQSAASLTKNLLSLSSGHLGSGSGAQAVGLVENGLQYTKSSNGSHGAHQHSKRGLPIAASSSTHGSAIAPTTQLDSVSKSGSRKSLPPAAEAPLTPVPASPRKTSEHHNGVLGLHHHQSHQQPLQQHHHHHQVHQSHQSHSRSSRKDNGLSAGNGGGSSSSSRKADEALWLWLAQQQQLLGQQAAAAAASASPYNPAASGVDGSWFWQWYKQCSFPVVASSLTASTVTQHQQQQQQQLSNKSPSKAKALLDNVLCNNNNSSNNNKNDESAKRSLNVSSSNGNGTLGDDLEEGELGARATDLASVGTTEEAIEHGEKFFKWLDKCSEPSVTRLQILQFKYLLDNLKTCRKKTSSLKQSRK